MAALAVSFLVSPLASQGSGAVGHHGVSARSVETVAAPERAPIVQWSGQRIVDPQTGVRLSLGAFSRTIRARLRARIADRRQAAWQHQDFLGVVRNESHFREHQSRSVPYLKWLRKLWTQRADRWWRAVVAVRDPEVAICFVFGPRYCAQAIAVAACESGDRDGDLSPSVVRAHNGQYLGCFQMGSWERATYGHGDTPLEQAQAAYRYFVASGRDWSPWSCKP